MAFYSGFYNYILAADASFGSGRFGVLSTVAVEEHFYLLLPLLFLFLSSSRQRFVALLCFVFFVALSRNYFPFHIHLTHSVWDGIALGCLIALVQTSNSGSVVMAGIGRAIPQRLSIFIGVILLGLVWLSPRMVWGLLHTNPALGIVALNGLCAMLVWFLSLNSNIFFNVPGIREILNYFGDRSFSIYVCHWSLAFPIAITAWESFRGKQIQSFFELSTRQNLGWLSFGILYMLILCILAELSWHLIEKPIRNYGVRLQSEFRKAAQTQMV